VLIGVLHLADEIELAAHDDVLQPEKQHAGLIGLRHKVPGAKIQRLLLRRYVRLAGHDDDRYGGVGRVLYLPQDGVSVHNGHDDVQQDRRYLPAAAQGLHGRLAVLGLDHVVFILQYSAEYLPVYKLILNDQNRQSVSVHHSASRSL
jgi:hypothetical protein